MHLIWKMRSEYKGFGIVLGALVLLVYSLTGVFASNTIVSEFLVDGCIQGEINLAVGDCSREGDYYCNGPGDIQNTITVEDACDFGDPDDDNYTQGIGIPQCCPSGYLCDENNNMKCGQRLLACSGYTGNGDTATNSLPCANNGCFWIEDSPPNGFCGDSPLDFSCSAYKTQTTCEEDVSNLGRVGFGTNVSGEYFIDSNGEGFVAPRGLFGCVWDSTENQCELTYDVTVDIADSSTLGNPDAEFTCYKNFSAGFCNEGSQTIDWNATWSSSSGYVDTFGLVAASECTSGTNIRSCGDPVIKLPGFSFFALFASIAILCLFYFLRRDD